MPTYEYKCDSCGRTLEAFQRISDSPLETCPSCKGILVRQIGIGSGIIFKGSGFYATDYRSTDYKEKAKKEASQETNKSASEKGKKETKTEK
ncbi:MAG: zinc ribbon domain-containing protein [Candidatus Theseobacter exili]|nr:zinc ribbon domain-containing protein [Candidatus Theseobacter exili]